MSIIEAEMQLAVQQGFDYSQIDEGIRDEVQQAANSIRAYGKAMQGSLIAIGKRLIEVKGMLPEGQFSAWIEAEFQLSQRSAQNFMNVARVFGNRGHEIISPLSDTVLYLLAAPSTPEEARVEVEQAAIEGKKITVGFAKEAIRKARPEPVYASIPILEMVVREWLAEAIGEGGTPTPDTVLDNLILQANEPVHPRGWTAMLIEWIETQREGLAWRLPDLNAAVKQVAVQRRHAARQANAQASSRVVYTEPEREPQPVSAPNPATPPDLVAAGYEIVMGSHERSWRWVHANGEVGDWWTLEFAIADARKRIEMAPPTTPPPAPQGSAAQPSAREGIIHPSWITHTLARHVHPDNADYQTALSLAAREQLVDALASLSTESKYHVERQAALQARLAELEPEPVMDELVELLISSTIDITTDLPMSLHWAVRQATDDDLAEALRRLPDDLRKSRGPVLEYALRKRGIAAVAAELADPRLAEARRLRDLLVEARQRVNADYGRLCGKWVDVLVWFRGTEKMIADLDNLIAIVGDKS